MLAHLQHFLITITITVQMCILPPTELDGSASQAEKAKPKIQYKIQSRYKGKFY